MSGRTKIEWADRVWNPITGCTKCSPACDNCYAERMSKRLAGRCGYPKDEPFRVTSHSNRADEPRHWTKPARIFVGSMTDLFHPEVPFALLDRLFGTMSLAKWHTFLVLTKRPERMAEYFATRGDELKGHPDWPLPNVWLGATIWDQKSADRAVPILLETPAARRFVSVEPMLGSVALDCLNVPGSHYINALEGTAWDDVNGELSTDPDGEVPMERGLDWVICGGETGPGARPMHPAWPRSLRDQCQAAGVPFFFKQWGEWVSFFDLDVDDPDWMNCPRCDARTERYMNIAGGHGFHGKRIVAMRRVGTRRAGRILDGRTWEEALHA